ncbi:PEP-utilizing enzyme [Streptomyces sp. 4N509B]|uniref:PEP-utilizing enzyme n=1 Tax=Streptomyces sp. 4N509B TaxID=3457413 RepID=UPI003FD19A7F
MTTLPTFSLDTPQSERVTLHSGHNFREVAPELLSPLTWSIIGSGMERGFRDAAAEFGRERPSGPRPHFVSYLGFRPYFTMTTIERLADELLVVDPEDIWEMLLGGPGPDVQRERRPGRLHRARRLPGALAFLRGNAQVFGRAQAELAAAEEAVAAALDSGGVWQTGAACDAAVQAARTAWALHIRTTSVALLAASLAKRTLRTQYDPHTTLELLRASAHRKDDGGGASARGGALTQELHRLNTYEVADRDEPFARFSSAALSAAASVLHDRRTEHRGEGGADEVGIPLGTALGPVLERVTDLLGLALGERERSKEVGLRALHCVRLLLDRGAFGAEPGEAALLGVHELRTLDARTRRRLVARRSEELAEAAALEYPVDVRLGKGLTALRRSQRGTGANTGRALAPGWAEGVLTRESDGEAGRILVGDRVDGNYVLAVLPDGVVSTYGSVLSHVAIVCRELGIPFVAGVRTDPAALGRRAVVDGWTGTVTVDAGAPALSEAGAVG